MTNKNVGNTTNLLEVIKTLTPFLATVVIAGAAALASFSYNKSQIELARINQMTAIVGNLYADNAKSRAAAAVAFSYYGKHAVPLLITLLDDPEPAVKTAAINSLELIGEEATPLLLRATKRAPSALEKPARRSQALVILMRLGAPGNEELVTQILEDPSESVDVRISLLEAIADTQDKRFLGAVEQLAKGLSHTSPYDLTYWTAWALGSLKSDSGKSILLQWLRHPDKSVRTWSYRSLASIRDSTLSSEVCRIAGAEADSEVKKDADAACLILSDVSNQTATGGK